MSYLICATASNKTRDFCSRLHRYFQYPPCRQGYLGIFEGKFVTPRVLIVSGTHAATMQPGNKISTYTTGVFKVVVLKRECLFHLEMFNYQER